MGTWFLFGIGFAIHGGIGGMFRVETHLVAYLWYLFLTFVVVVCWVGAFLVYGGTCTTILPERVRVDLVTRPPSFICGVSNLMVVVTFISLAIGVLWSMYLVWSMKMYVT